MDFLAKLNFLERTLERHIENDRLFLKWAKKGMRMIFGRMQHSLSQHSRLMLTGSSHTNITISSLTIKNSSLLCTKRSSKGPRSCLLLPSQSLIRANSHVEKLGVETKSYEEVEKHQ